MAQLTILVPVGPVHPYLDSTLKSIEDDIDDRARLLCIFDGCRPTAEVAARVEAIGSYTSLRKQEALGAVLNAGLEIADTEYVSRIDADDIWCAGRLDSQIAFMSRNPEVVAAGSNADLISPRGESFGRLEMGRTRLLGKELVYRNQLIHPSVVMRRLEVRTAGGYPQMERVEDYLLWLTLAKRHSLAHLDTTWVKYRRHAQQAIESDISHASLLHVKRLQRDLAIELQMSRCLATPARLAWRLAQNPRLARARRLWSRERLSER